MFISNWAFIGCVVAIVIMVLYQIFTGYTATHLSHDGTKIELRNQKSLYIAYAFITTIIFGVIEFGTIKVWGSEIIYNFHLGTSEQDQLRWVVIGSIAFIAAVAVFVAMLGVAMLGEICGRKRIVLRPRYTIIIKK